MVMPFATSHEQAEAMAKRLKMGCVADKKGGGCKVKADVMWEVLENAMSKKMTHSAIEWTYQKICDAGFECTYTTEMSKLRIVSIRQIESSSTIHFSTKSPHSCSYSRTAARFCP